MGSDRNNNLWDDHKDDNIDNLKKLFNSYNWIKLFKEII